MNSYIECYSYNGGNLKLIGIVDDFTSFTFERSYSNVGEWQIVISNSSNNAACLKKADFIKAGKGMSGLITKVSQVKNDTDDTLTVVGVELKGLTEKRIVMPKTGESHLTCKGTPEDVVKYILQWELTSPQDSKRQIAGQIVFDNNQENISSTVEWTPQQNGIGNPTLTNIRPIIGRDYAFVKKEDGTVAKMIFPETIYGGTINADGTGTITWKVLNLEEITSTWYCWGINAFTKGYTAFVNYYDWSKTSPMADTEYDSDNVGYTMCSHFVKANVSEAGKTHCFGLNTGTGYRFVSIALSNDMLDTTSSSTALTSFKEWLAEQTKDGIHIQIAYKLATPETFTATTETLTYEGRFSSVSEDINTICETYEIGWYADIEDGAIVWHIYRGKDRKTSQSTNSRFIISYDYDSMSGSSLEQTIYNTNTALIAGQGEGVDRATTIINDSNAGLNRTEVYIDARDIEDDSLLPQRGAEKLAEYGSDYVFEITPSNSYFINNYRSGYDLGDVGTLKEEGVDFRLTSITEINENNQFSLSFIFGYDTATLERAIKRMRGNTDALISKEA